MVNLIEPEESAGENAPPFTVSEISGAVKRTLEDRFGYVRVRGELGKVNGHRSGHVYLDLKDERACLAAVIWRPTVPKLEIRPEQGDEVVAEGRLTAYAGQSKYQLVIERLTYAGAGALLAKLERLKAQLAAEGLFDEGRKRPLPFLPRRIGVVTSPTGAVIRDILHRLEDRFPREVLVWPVAVQGAACAGEVSSAVRGFNAMPEAERPDLLIVARGGGSVEDLWGFNEEAVVRAVAESAIPVISAVGHETDVTLIDFAADRRAPTPTAAAEMAVPVRAELVAALAGLEARRGRALQRGLEERRRRLRDLARATPRPEALLAEPAQRLDRAGEALPRALKALIDRRRLAFAGGPAGRFDPRLLAGLRARKAQALAATAGGLRPALLRRARSEAEARLRGVGRRLDRAGAERLRGPAERLARGKALLGALSYAATLKRGFAIVRAEDDGPVTRAAALKPGAAVSLEFADGRVRAVAAGPEGAGPKRASKRPRDPAAKPAQSSLF